MTLGLPRCFDLAWAVTSKLLGRAPFDGVNVTELYFESLVAGRADPSTYIPMHPELRKAFALQNGFDPLSYRFGKIPQLLRNFSEWNEYDLVRVPGIGGTSSVLLDVTEMDGIRITVPEGQRAEQQAAWATWTLSHETLLTELHAELLRRL